MQDRKPEFSAAHRNAAVLRVLREAPEPIGPTDIAQRIDEDWCLNVYYPKSSAIVPVLRRIGAVRCRGGKYAPPASPTETAKEGA